MDVGGKRVAPLLPMFGIAPAILVSGDISLRDSLERYSGYLCRLSGGKRLSDALSARGEGVNSCLHLEPQPSSLVTSRCERKRIRS
jgi:hypothetical protein